MRGLKTRIKKLEADTKPKKDNSGRVFIVVPNGQGVIKEDDDGNPWIVGADFTEFPPVLKNVDKALH